MYQLQKKKRPLAVRILIFIFVCSMIVELVKVMFSQPSVKEGIAQAANNINKRCPMMVDSSTRLNNVIAGADVFILNYTLVTVDQQVAPLDTMRFKQEMKTEITNITRTNPLFKSFRDEQLTIQAMYSDKAGRYICSVMVTPTDYR